jgi:hypothetical protein
LVTAPLMWCDSTRGKAVKRCEGEGRRDGDR